jgi:hypothetical protein
MMKTVVASVLIGIGSSVALVVAAQTTTQQNPAAQQTSIIEGAVTREGSGQPLKGARVTLVRAEIAQNPLATAIAGSNAQGRLAVAALNNATGTAVTVMTDGNGKFTMTGVVPGQYRISANREGFIRNEYGQRTPTGEGVVLTIAANQRLTVDLQLIQAAVMSGRVITSDGEAAPNHTVSAHTYRYANGQRSLAEVATAQTNDLGEYRLFWLEPGDYFVSVTNDAPQDETAIGTVDVAQSRGARGNREGIQVLTAIGGRGGVLAEALGAGNPPIYYPGTLDPENAIPITVAASAEVRGVDFNLRPMRAATVSGRVTAPFPLTAANPVVATGPRGRGGNAGAVAAAQVLRPAGPPIQINLSRIGSGRAGLAGLIGLRLGSTLVNADGTFEIKGVAPGEYNLMANTRDANGQEYSARTRVSVGTADVANVVAALRPGADINGRILLSGTPPAQFRMTNLRVSLVAEDGSGPALFEFLPAAGARGNAAVNLQALTGGRSEAVLEDGTFTLKNVGAMEYRVQVAGLPQGAYVQAGRIGSNDALNTPFTVDDPQSLLQLQIAFSPGRVTGVVTDSRGMPTPGAQAVLVPDEARRGRNDSYFNATTNQEGQFNFNNVPPGSYKLFAWESVPAGAWQYPDFIRRYEDRGQTLTVNPNGTTSMEGKLIPAS